MTTIEMQNFPSGMCGAVMQIQILLLNDIEVLCAFKCSHLQNLLSNSMCLNRLLSWRLSHP